MPIEIRELQISVTVDSPQPQSGVSGSNNTQDDTLNSEGRKALIEHCIEQAVAIMNNKKER